MISLFDNPEVVAKFIADKKPKATSGYDDIKHSAHSRAFTVAKITRLDILKDIQASLAEAFRSGKGFDEWQKDLEATLEKKGWTSKDKLPPYRLRNIFNTNLRVAYNKARYESAMDSDAEYFRLVAVLDSRTRPSHKKMHGLTLPKTDPYWLKNYPPNGWGCRCKAQSLTTSSLKRRGITPLESSKGLADIADKDWAYNPSVKHPLYKVLLDKLKTLAGSVKGLTKRVAKFRTESTLSLWQKGLDEAVDEIIVKDNKKYHMGAVQVGIISATLANLATELLNKSVEKDSGIIITKKELTHAKPKRKGAYGHALRAEEIKEIVSILNDEDKAYVDLRKGHENIVFIFDDKKDSSRVNLIPIEISKTHKKFKMKNYIITLDKNNKDDILGAISAGDLVKIK